MLKRFADNPRLIAQARGERTYAGLPCRRGHDGTRYTNSQKCIHCSRDQSAGTNVKKRERRDEARAAQRSNRSHEVAEQMAAARPRKPTNPQRGNGWPFGRCFDSENLVMKKSGFAAAGGPK